MIAKRRMPVFGIGVGMQLLNVSQGGTLLLHIPEDLPKALPHKDPLDPAHRHGLEVVPGSLMERVYGDGEIRVNSLHHMAIDDVAPGFRVTARCPDGVVEAIESTTDWLAFGTQFHPESESASALDLRIFEEFITRHHRRSAGNETGGVSATSGRANARRVAARAHGRRAAIESAARPLAARKRWMIGLAVDGRCRSFTAALVAAEGTGLASRVEVVAPPPRDGSRRELARQFRRLRRGRRQSAGEAALLAARLAEAQAALLEEFAADVAPVWDRVAAVAVNGPGAVAAGRRPGSLPGAVRLGPAGRSERVERD